MKKLDDSLNNGKNKFNAKELMFLSDEFILAIEKPLKNLCEFGEIVIVVKSGKIRYIESRISKDINEVLD